MPSAPNTLIFVYDADGGLRAIVLDVLKKAVGREDCALCAIMYGPVGKRSAWKACERRLGLAIAELHRDELPPAWGMAPSALPCVLARAGDDMPRMLVEREEVEACRGDPAALEQRIRARLAAMA